MRAATNVSSRSKATRPSLTLLVPTDFSEPSKAALKFAAEFAQRYGGRVMLLSVIEPDPFCRLETHPLVVTRKVLRDRMGAKLSELGKQYLDKDRLAHVLIRSGVPFEQIVETAHSRKVDLIIMATRGHTGFKHLLLGSTADRVIRFATCPVLTVNGRENSPT
jgi:universal stress protein A